MLAAPFSLSLEVIRFRSFGNFLFLGNNKNMSILIDKLNLLTLHFLTFLKASLIEYFYDYSFHILIGIPFIFNWYLIGRIILSV